MQIAYILKNKDFVTRIKSRSGGVFSLISEYIFSLGGVVYGASLNLETQEVKHIRCSSVSEMDSVRGSKYVQSIVNDMYIQVKNDLADGKKVLFSGTPCQIAGIKSLHFLNAENLICIDIVCHGVPSNNVFQKYIEYVEHINKKKIVSFDFRNKRKYGWADHVETSYFCDGSSFDDTSYGFMFSKHSIVRPSCYRCQFKNLQRRGDITIGDAWGIDAHNSDFNDDNGVSLLIINSECGKIIFDAIKNKTVCRQVSIGDFMQEALKTNYQRPKERSRVWKILNKKGFRSAFAYTYRKHIAKRLLNIIFRGNNAKI